MTEQDALKVAADLRENHPFVNAFLIRCTENKLSERQVRHAIKRASAIPEVADEFEKCALLPALLPFLGGAAKFLGLAGATAAGTYALDKVMTDKPGGSPSVSGSPLSGPKVTMPPPAKDDPWNPSWGRTATATSPPSMVGGLPQPGSTKYGLDLDLIRRIKKANDPLMQGAAEPDPAMAGAPADPMMAGGGMPPDPAAAGTPDPSAAPPPMPPGGGGVPPPPGSAAMSAPPVQDPNAGAQMQQPQAPPLPSAPERVQTTTGQPVPVGGQPPAQPIIAPPLGPSPQPPADPPYNPQSIMKTALLPQALMGAGRAALGIGKNVLGRIGTAFKGTPAAAGPPLPKVKLKPGSQVAAQWPNMSQAERDAYIRDRIMPDGMKRGPGYGTAAVNELNATLPKPGLGQKAMGAASSPMGSMALVTGGLMGVEPLMNAFRGPDPAQQQVGAARTVGMHLSQAAGLGNQEEFNHVVGGKGFNPVIGEALQQMWGDRHARRMLANPDSAANAVYMMNQHLQTSPQLTGPDLARLISQSKTAAMLPGGLADLREDWVPPAAAPPAPPKGPAPFDAKAWKERGRTVSRMPVTGKAVPSGQMPLIGAGITGLGVAGLLHLLTRSSGEEKKTAAETPRLFLHRPV